MHGTFLMNFIVAEDIGSFPQREDYLLVSVSLTKIYYSPQVMS